MKGTVYFYDGHTETVKRYLKKSDKFVVFTTSTADYIYRSNNNKYSFLRVKRTTYEWGGYTTTFVPADYIKKIELRR